MTKAERTTSMAPDDARLLALLAQAREAEADYAAAIGREDDAGEAAAEARVEDALADMADTPAETWQGIAAKAARICRSLRDGGTTGASMLYADAPVAASLAADLARLAPGVVA